MAISIGDALLKLGVDTKDLDKGLKGLGNKIKKHQKAIGIGMAAVGGAILAAGALSVKTFATMGDEVAKMAKRTGFSTVALSELRHAAEISGASLASLEKGVKRMSMAILDAQDGLAETTRAFEHIGIAVEDLIGLTPEEQFFKIAEGIASIEDPTLRAATAQKLLGRAGTALLPLFAEGTVGMAALRQEAHDLGIVFDEETSVKAEEMTDSMLRIKEATSGLKITIAGVLVPVLIRTIDKIKEIVIGMTEWAKQHETLTRVMVILTTALGGLLVTLAPIIIMLDSLLDIWMAMRVVIMSKVIPAIRAFGVTLHLSLGVIGLILLAIAALIAIGILLWKNWDKVVAFFKRAWVNIKIFFLEGVYSLLDSLSKFTRFIPGLGTLVDIAKEKIGGMIDAERIKKNALEAERTLKKWADDVRENKDRMISDVDELYSEWEQRARNNTNILKREIDRQASDYREAHNERMEQLDAEYNAQLKIIDEELAALIEGNQDRIEAINETIDAQQKAEEDRRNAERIAELEARINLEEDAEERAKLEKELQGFLTELDRQRWEDSLREEQEALRKEINMARKRASEDRDQAHEELERKRELEKEKLESLLDGLAEQKTLLDDALQAELKRREDELEAFKEMNLEKIRDVQAFADTYNSLMAGLQAPPAPEAPEIVEGIPTPPTPPFEWPERPWLQHGGIAMHPMLAGIAERGPEAVIPLDRLGMMLGGKVVNIYVELDGRVIGRAIGQPLVDVIRVKTGVKI